MTNWTTGATMRVWLQQLGVRTKPTPTASGAGGMKFIRIQEKSVWNFERSRTFSRRSAGVTAATQRHRSLHLSLSPFLSLSLSLTPSFRSQCHYHLQSQFETCIIDETRLPRRQTKRGRAANAAYLLPPVCARTHARTPSLTLTL